MLRDMQQNDVDPFGVWGDCPEELERRRPFFPTLHGVSWQKRDTKSLKCGHTATSKGRFAGPLRWS